MHLRVPIFARSVWLFREAYDDVSDDSLHNDSGFYHTLYSYHTYVGLGIRYWE